MQRYQGIFKEELSFMQRSHTLAELHSRKELGKLLFSGSIFSKFLLHRHPQMESCVSEIMGILYANVDRASREDFHNLIDTWKEEEKVTIGQENLPENQANPKRDAIDAVLDPH